MNIRMIWFYVSLAVSACAGAGIMAVVSPSQMDVEQAMRLEQIATAKDCGSTAADRAYLSVPVTNSPAKAF